MSKAIGLLITDTHLSDSNISLVKSIFKQAIEVCKQNNLNSIIHLGDWFNSRKSQSEQVLLATREIIDNLRENNIFCNIIKGNHDATQADSEDSFLNIFDCDGFRICMNHVSIELNDDTLFWLLPYFKESGSYKERLGDVMNSVKLSSNYKTHYLGTHIATSGVRNNDGSQVENELTSELFNCFDKVFVGHYHNRSKIGENIHYIGSAYQANFGEDDNKGVTLILEDGTHKLVPLQFPKFINVKLNILDSESIKSAEKQYQHSDDNVRFIFEGDKAEFKKVDKEKLALKGIRVDFKTESANTSDVNDLVDKESFSFNRNNIKSAFKLFCDLKHIENRNLGEDYLDTILNE